MVPWPCVWLTCGCRRYLCGQWLFVTRMVQPAVCGSGCVLSEFIIQYYSHLAAARGCVIVSQSLSEMKQLLPFVIQQNVLSSVYFCNVCLRVVGLPCAKQSDLWPLDFIVVLFIYTGFGICLYYFNTGLHCSSFCDSQMIANDVRNAKNIYFLLWMHSDVSTKCDYSSLFQYFFRIRFAAYSVCLQISVRFHHFLNNVPTQSLMFYTRSH